MRGRNKDEKRGNAGVNEFVNGMVLILNRE